MNKDKKTEVEQDSNWAMSIFICSENTVTFSFTGQQQNICILIMLNSEYLKFDFFYLQKVAFPFSFHLHSSGKKSVNPAHLFIS